MRKLSAASGKIPTQLGGEFADGERTDETAARTRIPASRVGEFSAGGDENSDAPRRRICRRRA